MATCDITTTPNNRHSAPSPPFPMESHDSLRPPTQRTRSNSLPIMEALGCSTPEALLILAEGNAAVSTRKESARRRAQRTRQHQQTSSHPEPSSTYNPKDHLQYLETAALYPNSEYKERQDSLMETDDDRSMPRHSRYPSNVTDSSVSTVTASVPDYQPATKSPVGDYSANLARFIRAQLSSIPTYSPTHPPLSPSSCPDLSYATGASPRSPTRSSQRSMEPPKIIAMPPIRPPLQSAFSEWSSTDDDTDDDSPAISSHAEMDAPPTKSSYTPSLLRYYENSNNSSFLFTETPLDEEPRMDKKFTFPAPPRSSRPARSPAPVPSSSPPPPMPPLPAILGPPSSTTSSANPSLATSSAPSISTVSTGSYFDFKLNPSIRDRVIAAVTPPAGGAHPKIITANSSPFEGKTLANVHHVYADSQPRVKVDGMAFEMISDYPAIVGAPGSRAENGMHRVPTPC